MTVKFRAEGPYCPILQSEYYPKYSEVVYPTAWALINDNGVIRDATPDEVAELYACYSRSFADELPNQN